MTVTLRSDGDVSIIQMDDGKVNVFSPDMIKNFSEILDQVPTDKGSVLIAGREGMFSAGFDLKVMMSSPENAADMVKSGFNLLLKIFKASLLKPFAIITSKNSLFNSIARCFVILKLQETIPPKALTGSHANAEL